MEGPKKLEEQPVRTAEQLHIPKCHRCNRDLNGSDDMREEGFCRLCWLKLQLEELQHINPWNKQVSSLKRSMQASVEQWKLAKKKKNNDDAQLCWNQFHEKFRQKWINDAISRISSEKEKATEESTGDRKIGSMMSHLDMQSWDLGKDYYKNRDPMGCQARHNNYDPPGFHIVSPSHSRAEWLQIYRDIRFKPPRNSASIFLGHSNILTVRGAAMHEGKIVGLFATPIKKTLPQHLTDYYLPYREKLEYCRDLGRYFVVLEKTGVLTAPLTFDNLYLTNDPRQNTLKVPILTCTGIPYLTTDETRFFVDPNMVDGVLADYSFADHAYNWATLAICILLSGLPDYNTFNYEDIKRDLGDLEPSIRSCMNPDRTQRPSMEHVVLELDATLFPILQN